ncbi:MAG: hypothetical protein CME62_04550 [Halobacteriovoraceae bacterium]|nr:hypothetical protein [Halobacteriovoraceae bacterium]|tara:strand:+ start:10074 stop:11288 length:1215 start_codon:yes stop_codon:yes gene_type:complete
MRLVLFSFLIFLTVILGIGAYVLISPYYYYNQIVNQGEMNNWFTIANHSEFLVKAEPPIEISKSELVNENLWKKFHFKTVTVPLPVKNPFYFVAPVMKYNSELKSSDFGLSIFNAKDEILGQLYFLPKFSFPNVLNSQKIFELPVVRQHLTQKKYNNIWKDIFSKDISQWEISYGEMIYNLYLLELRSKLINKRVFKYNYISNTNRAIFQLEYKDKDYKSYLVLNKRGSYIYSFIMNIKVENAEAEKIKNKMLLEIDFLDTTESLADIIYQEFRSLPFARQIDHEGMLYLLSAWSHNENRLEILSSAIQFLERGRENQRQLEPLYEYVFARVGRTFSRRKVGGVKLKPEVLLKLNIELEEAALKTMIKEEKKPEKRLSIKEQYEKIIQETKRRLWDQKNKIRMN